MQKPSRSLELVLPFSKLPSGSKDIMCYSTSLSKRESYLLIHGYLEVKYNKHSNAWLLIDLNAKRIDRFNNYRNCLSYVFSRRHDDRLFKCSVERTSILIDLLRIGKNLKVSRLGRVTQHAPELEGLLVLRGCSFESGFHIFGLKINTPFDFWESDKSLSLGIVESSNSFRIRKTLIGIESHKFNVTDAIWSRPVFMLALKMQSGLNLLIRQNGLTGKLYLTNVGSLAKKTIISGRKFVACLMTKKTYKLINLNTLKTCSENKIKTELSYYAEFKGAILKNSLYVISGNSVDKFDICHGNPRFVWKVLHPNPSLLFRGFCAELRKSRFLLIKTGPRLRSDAEFEPFFRPDTQSPALVLPPLEHEPDFECEFSGDKLTNSFNIRNYYNLRKNNMHILIQIGRAKNYEHSALFHLKIRYKNLNFASEINVKHDHEVNYRLNI